MPLTCMACPLGVVRRASACAASRVTVASVAPFASTATIFGDIPIRIGFHTRDFLHLPRRPVDRHLADLRIRSEAEVQSPVVSGTEAAAADGVARLLPACRFNHNARADSIG